MFCYFKTKKFLLKNVTPGSPLLWSVKIFDTVNILKQRRVPLGKYFGTVRTESFGWKSRNPRTLFLSLSLSLSLSLFSSKLFDSRKLFEGRRVPLWKLSILWETKNNQQKFVPLPSFINKNFLYPKFSVTQEGSSTKWFGIMRQNNFDGKSWYRLPLLSIFFSDTRNIVKRRKFPLPTVSVLWDEKVSTENRDTRFLSFPHYISIPESSWKTEGILYEKVEHCERQKAFNKKLCFPTLLSMKGFDTQNYLKHRRVRLGNDSVPWNKSISTENRHTRHLFYCYFFR